MKRSALALLVSLLAGVLASTALSTWLLTRWPHHRSVTGGTPLDPGEVKEKTWPLKPPGTWPQAWPVELDHYSEWKDFGLQVIDARVAGKTDENGYSMNVVLSGWPMSTHYRMQVWFPQSIAYTGPIDVPCGVLVGGLIWNALAFSLAAWLVLFAAPYTVRNCIVEWRKSRRLCLRCSYPIGASPVCTECGEPVERQLGSGQQAESGKP